MDVVRLSEDRLTRWERYLQTSHHATFAHELEWRNVVEKTYHHTPYYLMATEGDSVKGVLPLFLVKSRIFGRFLVTAPYLSHGGLLAKDPEVAGALVDAARELALAKKARYAEIRGLSRVDHGLQLKEKYCTYLLPLDRDHQVVWGRLEQRARTAVRKAVKSGLAVEWGASLMTNFTEVLCRLMRDLGTPSHGKAFYRNILEEFSGRCEIFMVRYGDRFIGGGLTVTFKDTIAWLYGGCLKAFRNLAAMSLLTWEIIRYGCQQGSAYLDLGRSQWDSGTALFKRRWGAEPVPIFYEYYLANGIKVPDLDPSNPKFRLAIALWKWFPLWLTKSIGPWIIRDIL